MGTVINQHNAHYHHDILQPGILAQAHDHILEIVTRSGTSFRSGMQILGKDRRMAMYAIYAFCREVDDIADEEAPLDEKRIGLNAWRQEINALYQGQPTKDISRALLQPVRNYALQKSEFFAMIDGMEMDAETVIVAPTLDELKLYCRRVAGAVGLLSVRAFGAWRPDMSVTEMRDLDRYALRQGEALQLTNILRDLDEDARRGRLYMPKEYLQQAAILDLAQKDPLAAVNDPRMKIAVEMLGKHARHRYQQVDAYLSQCDDITLRGLRPARIMLGVYDTILQAMEQRGWDKIAQPISLSKGQKILGALRNGLFRRKSDRINSH